MASRFPARFQPLSSPFKPLLNKVKAALLRPQPESRLFTPLPPCYLPKMAEPLTLYLAAPRGFCAGVDRAIKIVEMALEKWGAPVYVRHEIVHNRHVVDGLRAKGAVFVEELDDCPPDRPVIFSAHGVPKAVPAAAEARQMLCVDATCPLVSKVHIEAERHHAERAADGDDRPRRPSRDDRHHGPAAARRGAAGRNRRRRRDAGAARSRPGSPSSPRPRCRSTTPPRSSPRCGRGSRRSSARTRRTSATPPPTARRRSRRWRRRSTRCW